MLIPSTLDDTLAPEGHHVASLFCQHVDPTLGDEHRDNVADLMIEIEQARSAVYWAACAVDEGSDEAGLALHSAKAFCADTFHMCAGNMIQLHGGIGVTWELPMPHYAKRLVMIDHVLGDEDHHLQRFIALGQS